jgi:hypothetical protein
MRVSTGAQPDRHLHHDKALRRTILRGDAIAHWGGRAVIVGLLLDIIIVCMEERPWSEKLFQVVANALIALGVFAELHFGRIASDARDELRSDAEERVAEANRMAQEARERAAVIEKTYAWRRISREMRDKLVSTIRETAHLLIIRIEHHSGDPEAHRFASDIGQVFADAGVTQIALMPNSYPFQSKYGVLAYPAVQLDATRLFEVFAHYGIPVIVEQKDLAQPTVSVNGLVPSLYIYVGMKPWQSSLENVTDGDPEESPAY